MRDSPASWNVSETDLQSPALEGVSIGAPESRVLVIATGVYSYTGFLVPFFGKKPGSLGKPKDVLLIIAVTS